MSAEPTDPPAPKRPREEEEEEELDEMMDVISHMQTCTLYVSTIKLKRPSRLTKESFSRPKTQVDTVLRGDDDSTHTLSGFMLKHGREIFVLPVNFLRRLNKYENFGDSDNDLYCSFPLCEMAEKMSDEFDRERVNGVSLNDTEFSEDEIASVREVLLKRDETGKRINCCRDEGFIEVKKISKV